MTVRRFWRAQAWTRAHNKERNKRPGAGMWTFIAAGLLEGHAMHEIPGQYMKDGRTHVHKLCQKRVGMLMHIVHVLQQTETEPQVLCIECARAIARNEPQARVVEQHDRRAVLQSVTTTIRTQRL